MEDFFAALGAAFTPYYLSMVFFGALVGILVGAMPGLSSVMGLTIVLPFTFSIDGTGGIFMLLGVFCGSIYGGSITAILINTPGTANSAATVLDGYPMATKMGQPGRALSISTLASTFGGLFSAVALLGTAPLLARVAMNFASPEYFALAVFGLTIVTRVSSKSIIKSLMGAILGLLFATVGLDLFSGVPRFTFGTVYFTAGIAYIPLMIALYAFSQGLTSAEETAEGMPPPKLMAIRNILPRWDDFRLTLPTMLRSSVIGVIIGAIPGTGGDIAAWVGYNEARRWSKHPEKFGQGSPEGIAAPESANNAISGGALIPLLTMGIPGDAGTAVMLGAFMMHGIVPGPLLFRDQGEFVYTIIVGLFIANVFMCLLGYAGLKLFAKIPAIPAAIMVPLIFILCYVGAFALNNNVDDIYFMIAAGIVAYILLKLEFSMPPIILGLILGGIMEKNLARSLVLSRGSFAIFFTRPISCALMLIAIATLAYPALAWLIRRLKSRQPAETAD
ncbi:MAG: tripartite tricarboxylate transporter permease [Planctomycetota bacterium]|jgi:putative tricarboxylic transport membrane protein|nr:tripartite tricarboxylate transporter permease [Planctomycetota bacterium]